MEKPRSVVYLNGDQTRVTLIGRWFHTPPEEINREYTRRLREGDPYIVRINDTLCQVIENVTNGKGSSPSP